MPSPQRLFLLISLSALLVVALAGAYWVYTPWTRPGEKPWSLILVTFDTTRADHLPAYGYQHVETPALDRMARNGIRYANCYSPAPLTLPSHTSIMTGLYPFSHGIHGNGTAVLDEGATTLAEMMRSQGYQTGAVVGAHVLDSRYGLDQGFDSYDDDFSAAPAPPRFGYAERNAQAVTDAAMAWLDGVEESPFFLWVHYFDPHMPYETPGYDPATATAAPYDAEIAYADSQLDRLLQRSGEIERATGRPAIVVFAGDHGEALWDHGEPTHGFFAYNETLRVPLIVLLPSASARGVAIETPVSLVDIYPSILRWLDLSTPYPLDGVPLPTSPTEVEDPPRSSRPLYFESSVPRLSYGWSGLEGVIVGHEKYIAAPRPELYDLASDPGETRNLFAESDPRVLSLRRQLGDLKRAGSEAALLVPRRIDADDESLHMLRALGYLGDSAPPPGELLRSTDPKDGIELHRRVLKAQTEIAMGKLTSGAELLEQVLGEDPDNSRALFLLLNLLNEEDVRVVVARILEGRMAKPLSAPFDRLLPLSLGVVRGEAGQWDEAEAALRIALEVGPGDPDANYQLARALLARGDRAEEALRHLELAHRSDPASLEYASALVQLAEGLGALTTALEVSERALERHPDHPLALNNAAWMHYRTRTDPEVALSRIRRAVSLEPGRPQFQHTYGCVLLWMDRAGEALPHLLEAAEAASEHAEGHYHLGVARIATGDADGALPALARALELAGQPPPWWLNDARSRLARLRGP